MNMIQLGAIVFGAIVLHAIFSGLEFPRMELIGVGGVVLAIVIMLTSTLGAIIAFLAGLV